MSDLALEVTDLVKHFDASVGTGRSRGAVRAVDGVSFSIAPGEVLGLVGESGSGKSTVANCVMRLVEPTAGQIVLAGRDITHLPRRAMRPLRREMHMVFQDPFSSLNPRMTAGQIVEEPLRLHRVAGGRELDGRVSELFDRVGLRAELRYRYPHELSGGQRQRVGIARALSLRPRLLIADEPISALDVSVQAAVLNLLRDIQEDMGFACLFIAHDLATVEYFCDRVAVMYLGRIVESGTRAAVFGEPKHPYTQALLSAAVVPDPAVQRTRKRVVLTGDIPSPLDPPSGCRFRTRCPLADRSAPRSVEEEPELRDTGGEHLVACHLVTGAGEAPRLVDVPPPAAAAEPPR